MSKVCHLSALKKLCQLSKSSNYASQLNTEQDQLFSRPDLKAI